ncbi:c-type cytochrome [Paenibacillus selenitireducens]|uniref:c-type cytochrome n=1 Tax=Paenibacillus selenitireducens TaxID=1324314 RepID=UPI001E4E2C97|nr:cytochrome c [Paenibacillus selenitireducens]
MLVATGCGQGASNQTKRTADSTPAEAEAAAIYKKQCLACHAADLSGRVGPNLQEVGSKWSEEQLADIIRDGAKGMPAFKKVLQTEEIDSLATWLSNHR